MNDDVELQAANFNRQGPDLPKLFGCYTRGVEFHWSIFRPWLDQLAPGSPVLDVGCGDLVETHYMAHRGLDVTAIDLDADLLAARANRRNWAPHSRPSIRAISLEDIAQEGQRFKLITAFDVIEHLPDSESTTAYLYRLCAPGGLVFSTVPNRRASTEIYFRALHAAMRKAGHQPPPGVPHLQFNSPNEWRTVFKRAGFEVVESEMAIGPVVNTWNLIFQVPLQIGLMLAEKGRLISRPTRHRLLNARWLHAPFSGFFHWIDNCTRPLTKSLYTWNLVVLRKPSDCNHSSTTRP